MQPEESSFRGQKLCAPAEICKLSFSRSSELVPSDQKWERTHYPGGGKDERDSEEEGEALLVLWDGGMKLPLLLTSLLVIFPACLLAQMNIS